MSVTVQLPPALAAQIREKAVSQGLSLDDFIAQTLATAVKKTGKKKFAEEYLLENINLGVPEKTWREYNALKRLRDTELLSPTQHERLIELSNFIEAANTKRMKFLVLLAKLRNTTLRQLMEDLGISQPAYA